MTFQAIFKQIQDLLYQQKLECFTHFFSNISSTKHTQAFVLFRFGELAEPGQLTTANDRSLWEKY